MASVFHPTPAPGLLNSIAAPEYGVDQMEYNGGGGTMGLRQEYTEASRRQFEPTAEVGRCRLNPVLEAPGTKRSQLTYEGGAG